ncbi:glycosyl hydrolase family 28-related protein [Cerasicoccus arenae]|uniref:Rhamnogalacturonase A/B/Epimerase-like pectate lyase domain-containing protein n=2 Tax=Cerasicoccus arenae TaxID=424488 RepID=A0A8J3DC10_9BACT|nr:glycosyl hydrolase family 28-related protein [Cerasicoccus arenae]MBK1859070.1 hypothetical protein [Cerasicoccus arenae]GHC03485.1 hypothetical protein GCM10007047_20100 [Cerasicoccus arenae]
MQTTQPKNVSSSIPEGHWQSELYSENWEPFPSLSFESDRIIQDFSYAGYASGEQPIPSLAEAPVINVTEFGADPTGEADSTKAIQDAINRAASLRQPVVVYMPEGTYRISPQRAKAPVLIIRKSNIVLRGAGVDKTRLFNDSYEMRGQSIIHIAAPGAASWSNEEGAVVPIVQDLPNPTIEIPIADSTQFQVGEDIIIRADPTVEWIEDHHETDWLGYEEKIGSMLYLRRIKAIDREQNVLTIDIPTRYMLKQSYNARVYPKTGILREIGLEDFSIGNREHPGKDGWENLDFATPNSEYTKRLAEGYNLPADFAEKRKSAADVHFSYAITMVGVADSWIRNVQAYHPDENGTDVQLLSNGIRLKECQRISVINCIMRYPQYGGGGGNGYMFRLDNCNECLLENCTAAFARHGYSISGMASSGNVLYRCQDIETGHQVSGSGHTQGKGSDHHMYFSHSNLFDNCVAENSWFEARDRYYERMSKPKHNTTSAHTVFWNSEGRSNRDRPYAVWSMQAKYGYVIGTKGAASDVRTNGDYPERAKVSDPVDHVEGIGQGSELYPVSLFQDQRARRLGTLAP